MKVEIDARELTDTRVSIDLVKKHFPQVLARVLNHAGNKARTQTVREAAKQAGIQYGKARDEITTSYASAGKLSYELHAKGRFMSLRAFAATQRKKGISARPWGRRRTFEGAFFGPGGQVFIRGREGRLKKLWGSAIPREFLRDRVPAIFENEVRKGLDERLKHELARVIPQSKGR